MERMRKIRDKQSEDEKKLEKEKLKERMRNLRAKLSEDEKKVRRENLKERMRDLRAEQSDDEKESLREEAKKRMANIRNNRTEDKKDYENLIKRQHQRKVRASYSGKQHLKSNLIAKKGMRLFHEEGRLNDFSSRESAWKKIDQKNEIKEWKRYMEKSEAHRETLNENEPDIVEKINAHIRQEKENQKLEMENKKKREEELSHLYDNILSEEEENEEDVGYITLTKE